MLTRRQALLGFGLGFLAACASPRGGDGASRRTAPASALDPIAGTYVDNVDALFDVLIPAERDAAGAVTVPGAREVGAGEVIAIDRFAVLVTALGLLPPLPDATLAALAGLGGAARATINADLDLLSVVERPLGAFRDLSRAEQEAVVERAFADPVHRPAMLAIRAACFLAYLGAVTSDEGLRAIGFPPFEDFADGIAVSGYPRKGEDYTFNEPPPPTAGDDLAGVLDENGDLV